MTSSTEGLVPITRAFLAQYYDKYPLDPLSDDVARLTGELRGISADLLEGSPLKSGESIFLALSLRCWLDFLKILGFELIIPKL